MRTPRISGLSAVLTALMALLAFSCGKQEAVGLEMSVRTAEVSSEAGSMFVSVKCSGDWTLSLSADDGDAGWASLNVQSGKGDRNNVVLTYQANEDEQERILTITAQTVGRTSRCTVTQAAYDGQQGGVAPSPGTDPGGNLTKTSGWLELPAMDDADLKYYSHSFEMYGKTYRNYSFGYSEKDYLAVWVAYPLCKLYTNGSYSNSDWMANPSVDTDVQPDFSRSFGFSSGYERGHQIANADRKCCREANQQTYYFTNATLQHKNFNGKIWANLEGRLRTAAGSSDTLYVVTGCVVPENPDYISDYQGHKVPVPSGYFKAALRYAKASTLGTWLAAAFYLDHKTYSYENVTSAEAMSIDELEEKVGIDFFVNLVDKIGREQADAVEAQNPVSYPSVWGIN